MKTRAGRKGSLKPVIYELNCLMANIAKLLPGAKSGQAHNTFPLEYLNMGWDSFRGYKLFLSAGFALTGALAAKNPIMSIIFAAAGMAAGFWLPDILLNMELRKRNQRVVEDLPYVLDLLYISTLSGQNIYKSMELLSKNYEGEVSRQFKEFIQNIKYGRGKHTAYQSLLDKNNPVEFGDILNLLRTTEDCGSSISEILKQKSEQIKFEVSQAVERKSRRVSLLMLFPLALLILPSFMVLVGGTLMFTIGSDFINF